MAKWEGYILTLESDEEVQALIKAIKNSKDRDLKKTIELLKYIDMFMKTNL